MNKLEYLSLLKEEIDKARPLDKITLDSIISDLRLKYTSTSTALEGNTLSIYETKAVIEDGITIGGKTVREHLEVINHDKAVTKLFTYVKDKAALNAKLILDFHETILKGINDEWAGRFRNQIVYISGAKHIPVSAEKVYDSMLEFEHKISELSTLHPVAYSALIHANLVRIHPFIDGNGRTARLIMNLELMKAGYPIVLIEPQDKGRYCDLLQATCKG